MKAIIIVLISFVLVSCSKTQVVYEYQEVLVPVRTYIETPKRPQLDNKSITRYLIEVLEYIDILELIITKNNEGLANE